LDQQSDFDKCFYQALGCLLYKLAYYKTPFEDGGKLKILNACVEFPEDRRYSKNLHTLISTNAFHPFKKYGV
jgi:hypothetical protein